MNTCGRQGEDNIPVTIEESLAEQSHLKSLEKRKIYYPNDIGFPTPCPRRHYEFALLGLQNEKHHEALAQILKMIEDRHVGIVSLSFFNDQSPEQYVMNMVLDFTMAKCTPADLVIRLNRVNKFVKIAEMVPASKKIFGSFLFPLTFFGRVRALAIDADRFTKLFSHMTEEFGEKAGCLLFDDGHSEGNEIIKAIREFFERDEDQEEKAKPFTQEDYVFENARAFLRASGWGTISVLKMREFETYCVTVWDPPTDVDGGMATGNYFLQGMIAGIIEPLLEREEAKLSVMNESYERETRTLTLYYIDRSTIQEEKEKEEVEKLEEASEVNDTKLIENTILIDSPVNSTLQTNGPTPSLSQADPIPSLKKDEAKEQAEPSTQSIEMVRSTGDNYEKIVETVAKQKEVPSDPGTNSASSKNMKEATDAETDEENTGRNNGPTKARDARKQRKRSDRASADQESDSATSDHEDSFWL